MIEHKRKIEARQEENAQFVKMVIDQDEAAKRKMAQDHLAWRNKNKDVAAAQLN